MFLFVVVDDDDDEKRFDNSMDVFTKKTGWEEEEERGEGEERRIGMRELRERGSEEN